MISFNDTKTFSVAFQNTNCHFNLVGCEFEFNACILIIPARFTRHHRILHTHRMQHTIYIFAPACHMHQKILYITNLSQSTQLHPHMIHTEYFTSTYENIYAPDWFDLKIDSIKSDNSPLGQIKNKWIQTLNPISCGHVHVRRAILTPK